MVFLIKAADIQYQRFVSFCAAVPLYCRHHGTTARCLGYRDVRILEASGILLIGVAMYTVLLSATNVRSRALPCCTLVRKTEKHSLKQDVHILE